MKNKVFLFSVVVVISTITGSCKKFLDKQPITSVGPNIVFSDVNSAYHAIAGVYSQLAGDAGYGKVMSMYFTVDDDISQGRSGTLDNGSRDLSRYFTTPGNIELNRNVNPFLQCFKGIEFANICIANIPKMDMYVNGSEQQKAQLRRIYGEALTLRAQFYFAAITNWGDAPEQFQPASTIALENPFPKRIDRDILYDRIIADLKLAEDLVPWVTELAGIGDPVDERITKGTVKGLRARIALFRGGYSLRNDTKINERRPDYLTYYQIAKDECAEIIQANIHSLNPSFKSLWKDQVCSHAIADPHNELMFQVGAIGGAAVADSKIGYYNGPQVNSFGTKGVYMLPTFFYSFDPADKRRVVTCAPYNSGRDGITKTALSITNIADGKYRRDWITNPVPSPTDESNYFGLKWQLLRYSDILLMYAEAANELNNGPTDSAYNCLNQVRRRGFGLPINNSSAIDITGLGKAEFFDVLVKERAFELAGEGIRKYDLIRWNLLEAKINETKVNLANLQARTGVYTDLPTSMYYRNGSTADDDELWANSLYEPAPSSSSPPPNSTRVSWIGSSITTTILARYALGFTPNKSELFPLSTSALNANYNFSQNPNY